MNDKIPVGSVRNFIFGGNANFTMSCGKPTPLGVGWIALYLKDNSKAVLQFKENTKKRFWNEPYTNVNVLGGEFVSESLEETD